MPNNDQKPIVSAIIIAGVLIAGAVLLKDSKAPVALEKNPPVGTAVMGTPRAVSSDDHIVGDLNAKVIIVEYSDLECPFCKVFHNTMQQVVENTGSDVAWVYRHYPIPQLHQKAFHEAEATECAWEQGGNDTFWRYTDRVFEITPSNDGLEESELSKIAQYIGLNTNTFEACLASGKFVAKIEASIADGNQAGVSGTPKGFILRDGKVVATIDGAEPFATVKAKIDSALK